MARLTAYLFFDHNCKEAMNFYQQVFGGELFVQDTGSSPVADHFPPEMKDTVLHAMLTNGNLRLMASDSMVTEPLVKGNNVFLCLECESKEEMDTHFAKLSEGGKVTYPLKEEFFGWHGQLEDKYGMHWMFQFSEQK